MDEKSFKSDKPRSGFVIKLSTETAQKLAEEEQLAKNREQEVLTDSISNQKDSNKVPKNCTEDKHSASDKQDKDSHRKVNVYKEELTITTQSNENQSDGSQSQAMKANADKNDMADSDPNSDTSETWGEYTPYITYEGETAIYTDPSNQLKYSWSKESKCWDPLAGQSDVPGRAYSYEDDTHIYTEADGSKFFWDIDKKAWIPKLDDDFLAYYQMSYGFVDNTSKEEETKKKDAQNKADSAAGVKRKNEPQWFEPSDDTNTKVYVSNLPLDLTEEEFVNFMQKCGLVERDPSTQKMKVKMYKDKEHDCFKGDALCTYIKIESVELALKLLDGADLKGNKVKVERAHFQLKGEYNPALKPKKKKKKELEKLKKMQQKLFDWRPEKFIGERSKHERVVIVKNLFHPTDFDKEVQLILDYQQDLREECSKVGEVRKVVIYDRHPQGVAQVTMKEPEMADAAVQLINGRWFGKRQITAEIWDGKTKYKIAETDADINQRVDKWEKFLEGKEEIDKSTSQSKSDESTTAAETKAEPDKSAEDSINKETSVGKQNPEGK